MRLFTEDEMIAVVKAVAKAEREVRNRSIPPTVEEMARLVILRVEESWRQGQ